MPDYVIGASTAATGFPAYHWRDINNNTVIRFNLTSGHIRNHTLRAGITAAANARPMITVNAWSSATPAASPQPTTR